MFHMLVSARDKHSDRRCRTPYRVDRDESICVRTSGGKSAALKILSAESSASVWARELMFGVKFLSK